MSRAKAAKCRRPLCGQPRRRRACRHAVVRRRTPGRLARTDPAEAEESLRISLLIATIFLISIPVAFINPHLAPYLWLALFAGRFFRKRT